MKSYENGATQELPQPFLDYFFMTNIWCYESCILSKQKSSQQLMVIITPPSSTELLEEIVELLQEQRTPCSRSYFQ